MTARTIVLTTLLIVSANLVFAGKYNTVLEIGAEAPAWNKLPGTDGKQHSMSSISDAKVVVVAFTCNTCPYANDAEDRLQELTKRFADQGVALVAISVNKVEEDQLPAMVERSKQKEYNYPYLWDQSQQIAKAYGAKFTPEFFVLDQDRKIVYMGSFDDSPAGDKVTKTFVSDAVEAALAGKQPNVTETAPIGCLIRYERIRRTRKR